MYMIKKTVRNQFRIFCLEQLVAKNYEIRFYDVFVDSMDLPIQLLQ